MKRAIDFIVHRRNLLAILGAASVLLPLYFLPRLRIDNSLEVWVMNDSQQYRDYQDFQDRFGSDEFVVLGFEFDNPLSDENLAIQEELAADLDEIEGVASVSSLPTVRDKIWFRTSRWQEKAAKSSFLQGTLLGSDAHTAGMFIWLEPFNTPQQRRECMNAIEHLVSKVKSKGITIHLAGVPRMNVALDRASQKASMTLFPVSLALALLVLAFSLRSAGGVIAPVVAVGATVIWTIGIMAMLGQSLNMVTVALPSLLFVLSISGGIHIAARYQVHLQELSNPNDAIRAALEEVIRPAFYTCLTTAFGFGSLMISDMKPVVDLGRFAAIGMVLSFLFNLSIVPGVLTYFQKKASKRSVVPEQPLARPMAVSGILGHPRFVVIGSLAILILLAWASTGMQVESNVLEFFSKNSSVYQDYEYIGKHLTGFYTLELETSAAETHEKDTLAAFGQLEHEIEDHPAVARVFHHGQLLPLYEKIEALGNNTAINGIKTSDTLPYLDQIGARYKHKENKTQSLRFSIMVRAMSSAGFYSLLDFVEDRAAALFPKEIAWHLTGVVSLLNDVQRSLIRTQIESFGLAAFLVLASIGICFRSLGAAIVSILPNLLPIFATFGFMYLVGIPLNTATVMIAGVAIGIAADDTIYFLAAYFERLHGNSSPFEAVTGALKTVRRAVISTTLVIATGFVVLCLAEFRPLVYFGLLTAITMLTALLGDLIVLPACCMQYHKLRR